MLDPLKIIFAGTPEFAIPGLQALLDSPHQIVAVYTQPDRQAGRGRKMLMSPVKQLALLHQLAICQPSSLNDLQVQQAIQDWQADIIVVIAYGLRLPPAVLAAPRLGCLNVHASLLPRWRGAAPIQHAILAGDTLTGITIMQMDQGMDTGAMLKTHSCLITATDTSQSIQDRLAKMGSVALIEVLKQLQVGTQHAVAQDNSQAVYAHKISKQAGQLDWNNTAEQLTRQIRAYYPWPVAYTLLAGQPLRILQASVQPTAAYPQEIMAAASPGTIVAANPLGIDVKTATQVLRIEQLQFPGGVVISSQDCLNARAALFACGKILG